MLIGITGKLGAGKTFSSKILIDYFNAQNFEYLNSYPRSEICSLGDTMKNMAKIMFPIWTDKHTKGLLKEVVDPEYDISPRKVLQIIGKGMLEIRDSIWSDLLFSRLKATDTNWNDLNKLIVVDDIRYHHDMKAIKQRQGIMVGVIPTKTSNVDNEIRNHDTEKHIDDLIEICDYTFINDFGKKHVDQMKGFAEKLYKGEIE